MKYYTARVRLDDNKYRVRNVLTGEPTPNLGPLSVKGQWQLLQTLHDTPSLGVCGNKQFEKLRMYYNGTAWEIEMESINDSQEK